jgi:hypothetical protein
VAPLDVVDVVDSVVTAVAAEVVEVCSPIFSKLQKSTRVVRACDDACSMTTSGLVCKA